MKRKVLLLILLLGFAGYAAWAFSDSVTPYVSIEEAQRAKGSVQVKGLLDPQVTPHQEGEEFVFSLRDEDSGQTMPVRYAGTKPDRFEEAYHIVAIGRYSEGVFHAEKLLIKCPSKYENQRQK